MEEFALCIPGSNDVLMVTSGMYVPFPKIIVGPKDVMEEIKKIGNIKLPLISIYNDKFKLWMKDFNSKASPGYTIELVHIKSVKDYKKL